MTKKSVSRRRNLVESLTAFALQRRAPMRLAFAFALLAPLAAYAQSPGTCSGMGMTFAGSAGLSVPDGKGSYATVQSAAVASVFGNAECACAPNDPTQQIAFEIKLTSALPLGTGGNAEVWVGSGCDTYTNRNNPSTTTCQKIASPNIQTFTTAGSANNAIEIPIPGDALMSPNKCPHDCSAATNPTGSNGVYLLLFSDPNAPFAKCVLPLSEQNQGPQGVSNPSASSGDGAITLNWTVPTPGSYNPSYFQVLCSDDAGNPVSSSPSSQPVYSTCINGTLARRQINTGGNPPTGTDDAGTTSTDMAMLRTGPGPDPNARVAPPNDVTCTPDLGGAADMATATTTGIFTALAGLDPRYICTGQLQPTQSSARITGLTNYQKYHFVVLSIDQFGNATPSNGVDGIPQPTEDLWRRYRAAGGLGGCVVAAGNSLEMLSAFGLLGVLWLFLRLVRKRA